MQIKTASLALTLSLALASITNFTVTSFCSPVFAQKTAARNATNSSPKAYLTSAISLYNSGKFSQALPLFEAVARADSRNVDAHYYIALCCHQLNQTSRAAKEYQYAAFLSPNSAVGKNAQRAFDALNKANTSLASNGDTLGLPLSSPAARQRANAASRWGAIASATAGQSAPPRRVSRVKKVIEFYTTWCGVCTRFAPTFEETKSRYAGQIEFQKLDAEDDANAELRSKYSVTRFPTLIFLDKDGNLLKRGEGAPMGPNFANTIESL
jgi:thioredoxin 1